MAYYGFEYFSGANVIVSVEGMPLLECAGLQYEVRDSKMPLYGYSSRHYDAVAAGQVIVQGQLLINYIHNDYLFRAVQRALGQIDTAVDDPGQLIPAEEADLKALVGDYEQAAEFIRNMKAQYWAQSNPSAANRVVIDSRSPHDIPGGVDVVAAFGKQSSAAPYGKTAVLLRDVHFTGRGNVIRIDEEVIVEAYPFFARDVFSMRNPMKAYVVGGADAGGFDADQQTDPVTSISTE